MSPGTVVVLPCGDIGEAYPRRDGTTRIMIRDRWAGRGPWIFQADQLVEAGEDVAAAYQARCNLLHGGR